MAFDIKNFSPVGANAKKGSSPQVFSYKTDLDSLETIYASGYFDDVKDILEVGDIIIIKNYNGNITVDVTGLSPVSIGISPLVESFLVEAHLDDVSTASSVFMPMSKKGYLYKAYVALNGNITSSDATITIYKGTNVLGTVTIPAGSTGGYVTQAFFFDDLFEEGETVKFETDGASTGTASVSISASFRIIAT